MMISLHGVVNIFWTFVCRGPDGDRRMPGAILTETVELSDGGQQSWWLHIWKYT